MHKDELGDRMKAYESVESSRKLDQNTPIVARIDGRGFSKFTKGFDKPFDKRLNSAMNFAASKLVESTHANVGYTQSDEITLIWKVDRTENPEAQVIFGGRVQKLVSVLAGLASSAFYSQMDHMGFGRTVRERMPHFDCRVWNVPSEEEAVNTLMWRYLDARKNAVSIFTRQYVGHKDMQGLDGKAQLAKAYENGAPKFSEIVAPAERFGRIFRRTKVEQPFPMQAFNAMPIEKRASAPKTVNRTVIRQDVWDMANISNLSDCVFYGAEPLQKRHTFNLNVENEDNSWKLAAGTIHAG